ncbi:MAG: hypothetical protein COY58_02185 [Gammaproteobacteria bacterium CG_4_10_14_0_8_um_filter_38_16]|nr:MAG: hypothetical protein COY58_02185 [Gammaproteobacteria bacterium CG_4_10_14_0_8_um_filter_38_16]PJA04122.1 MAG: hypothetical protein COX72_01970 [Gammaproteobacteria bacterium CG_4_10_14_0_2_um_filter_38_22]PJB10012.1 MAG: hypothetical protein CO120_06935 [Gammaproteobacteria bacterium CG_4_9_14_3_um_filter_38_9]
MRSSDKGSLLFAGGMLSQIASNLFKRTKIDPEENKPRFQLKIALRNECKKIIYFCFFIKNVRKLFKVYQLLNDPNSKKLFEKLILFRLLGYKHIQIREDINWENEKKALDSVQLLYDDLSDLNLQAHPAFGALNHYKNIPTETDNIALDSWGYSVVYVAIKKQYYLEKASIKIKPEAGDIVIDAGGCLGDNAVYFAKSAGKKGHIYVFDPLPTHKKVIEKNIAQNQLTTQITYLPYAVGKNTTIHVNNSDSANTIHTPDPTFHLDNHTQVPTISIDDFVQMNGLNKIDFIKMDIEGGELSALQGAVGTIKKFKPKLAISIYHKWEDFYVIPLWIHNTLKDYIFFIDHYTMHTGETILYAIAK